MTKKISMSKLPSNHTNWYNQLDYFKDPCNLVKEHHKRGHFGKSIWVLDKQEHF